MRSAKLIPDHRGKKQDHSKKIKGSFWRRRRKNKKRKRLFALRKPIKLGWKNRSSTWRRGRIHDRKGKKEKRNGNVGMTLKGVGWSTFQNWGNPKTIARKGGGNREMGGHWICREGKKKIERGQKNRKGQYWEH